MWSSMESNCFMAGEEVDSGEWISAGWEGEALFAETVGDDE